MQLRQHPPARQRILSLATILALLLTTLLGPTQMAQAAPATTALNLVQVSAPDINCIFDTDCTITVSDISDTFTPPGARGQGFLQSRTWPVGEAGTPGAGLYAYLYRIDLRAVRAITAVSCVTELRINFGPIRQMNYNGDRLATDDVFIVTKGGLGNVMPASAEQDGDVLTFHFNPGVCPGTQGDGDSSFFFGLASTQPPQDTTADLTGTLKLAETLAARAPRPLTFSGKIAYVFKKESTIHADYVGFLQSKGFTVTQAQLGNVLTTDFAQFDLTIIADDTGSLSDWGSDPAQVSHIADHSPVLGLAEGGYAFFGKLNLHIGWPNGWHNSLDRVVTYPALSYYQSPYDLSGQLSPMPLTLTAVGEVGIHLPEPVAGVTVLGTEPASQTHHPLIGEGCDQLWGFASWPQGMTDNGRNLFINAVMYGINHCRRTQSSCVALKSAEEIPAPGLVNFDDLPDAQTIGDAYASTFGLHFYAGNDTKVISYGDRASDPTKARSKPNVASNDAISPTTSAGVPMTFSFDQPKTHVGFYMGNGGQNASPTAPTYGSLVAYDKDGAEICETTGIAPETYTQFIGLYDKQGRMAKITLDYFSPYSEGGVLNSESIDDLSFAPNNKPPVFAPPEQPPFAVPPPTVTIQTSTNQTFTANIDLPKPQLINLKGPDNINYVQFVLPGVDINGNTPGLPDVPISRQLLAVPHGAQVKLVGVQAIPGDQFSLELYPAQPHAQDAVLQQQPGDDTLPPPETFQNPPFTKNADAYASDQLFPAEIVSVQPMGQLRDLDLVQLNIAGGQYNPKTKLLTLFKAVQFEVKFEGGDGGFLPKARNDNPFEHNFDGVYAQVLNKQAIYDYQIGTILNPICWGEEYLIISDPAFHAAADALRTWKNSRGLSTRVVDTGNAAGNAGTTREQIRDYIRNQYNNCLVRPSYLLLLGDTEFIPVFQRDTVFAANAGTDLDYALMNNSDIMPDLAYGRIPVDTLADAQTVVNKIIQYEQHPPANASFYKNVSLASYFECCNTSAAVGDDGRSFVETSELVRNALLTKGYTVQRIYTTDAGVTPKKYNNGANLPADLAPGSGFAWNGSTTNIVNAINAGRFLVMHRDHGGPNGWVDPSFTNSNLASLTNGALTSVVYSVNCASGLFDNESAGGVYGTNAGSAYWAERMLRMSGGAVGIIGDTRNSPTWANSALARGFFDATWPNTLPSYGSNTSIRRLGDILNYAKAYVVSQVGVAQTAGSISSSDANTELILYHVFGDPSMKLWTSNPYQITFPWYIYDKLTINPKLLEVKYPIVGATISALQDGNPVARGEVGADGSVKLAFINDVDAAKPIDLSAVNPDGTGAALGQANAQGAVTPQDGGTVEHADSKFKLTFGNGAVDAQIEVFYTVLNGPSKPLAVGQKGVHFFTLNAFDEAQSDGNPAEVTHFNKPFSLELGYSDAELAAQGIDENNLTCQYLDEATGQWKPLPSQVDAVNNKVTCSTDHFTEFVLASKATQATQSVFLPWITAVTNYPKSGGFRLTSGS